MSLRDTDNCVEKDKTFCQNAIKYLREYNEVTGIHGLRYLTEKRSKVEKIFWAIILLISLGGCIYMIYEIVEKYKNSPVVVNFATKDTPIYDIPFPAVTICPEAKCSRDLFNFTDIFIKYVNNETIEEEELRNFYYMSFLCETENYQKFENVSDKETDAESFITTLDVLKPELEMICVFMGKQDDNCSEMATPIITDEGICFSLNIIDKAAIFRENVVQQEDFHCAPNGHQFDGEDGYSESAGIETYPRRALRSGADHSLEIFLVNSKADTDYLCSKFLQGYKVSIHNPMNIPQLSKHYFHVPLDKVAVVAIQPELVTTSDAVRKFSPHKRECYFGNEKSLKYFKLYTQSNCRLECFTNYTLNRCGCVNFFMPRDNSTEVCGIGKLICLKEAEIGHNLIELEYKINPTKKPKMQDCDCKPLCTNLEYNVETSHSDFFWKEYFAIQKAINKLPNISVAKINQEKVSFSVLSIYFKTEQFVSLERNELYGTSDLISNFGGLLGLFTGFSLITLIEIIYFLTLRIFYNKRIYGLWAGPPS